MFCYFLDHQGTGVESYFHFLRWIFFMNLIIFLLPFLFVVLPFALSSGSGYTTAVTGSGTVSGVLNTSYAETCSALYVVTESSAAGTLIQDFLQGSVSTI